MNFNEQEIKLVKEAAAARYSQLGIEPKVAQSLYDNFVTNILRNEKKASEKTLGDIVSERLLQKKANRQPTLGEVISYRLMQKKAQSTVEEAEEKDKKPNLNRLLMAALLGAGGMAAWRNRSSIGQGFTNLINAPAKKRIVENTYHEPVQLRQGPDNSILDQSAYKDPTQETKMV